MKQVIVCLATLVALGFEEASAQGWEWQYPPVQGNNLFSVAILSADTVWAVGDRRTFLYTTDGGNHWSLQHPNVAFDSYYQDLGELRFADSSHGWMLIGLRGSPNEFPWLNDASLLHTTDGGFSWSELPTHDSLGPLIDYTFLSENLGWITGFGPGFQNTLARTTDGGSTWTNVLSDSFGIGSISFLDSSIGWVGGSRRLFRTSDGGETWQRIMNALQPFGFYRLQFLDSLNGWASGYYGNLALTADGGHGWTSVLPDRHGFDAVFHGILVGWAVGANGINHTTNGQDWIVQQSSGNLSLDAIKFLDDSVGWAVGNQGLIYHTTNGGNTWTLQAGVEVAIDFKSIAFSDQQHGWAAGQNGDSDVVFHTTDGGATWLQQSRTARFLWSICAYGSSDVWAGRDSGFVLRSTDGGNSWIQHPTGADNFIRKLRFTDPHHGWAYAQGDSVLYRTSDGGSNWSRQGSVPLRQIYDFSFPDANHGWLTGWMSGSQGCLFHSTDGGNSWSLRDSSRDWYECDFADINHGWVSGYSDSIWHTTDGGATWTAQFLMADFRVGEVHFGDSLHGVVLGDYGSGSLVTSDGGNTWQFMSIPSEGFMNGGEYVGANNAWICGENSSILHYSNPLSAPRSDLVPRPSSFTLSAYPNPFNPSTVLSFDVPVSSRVQLKVYDLTGRLVQTLADQRYPAGQFRVNFNGSDLASGIYFVRLQSPHFSNTEKLILLK